MSLHSYRAMIAVCMLICALLIVQPSSSVSDDLPPGVTIQRVTASGVWMCNVINGKQGECAVLSLEFYNVGQLVDGYGDATVTCIWQERKTPLDVTGKYFTGGPNGKVYFEYAGHTVIGQLVNGEYITFEGNANDIPIDNPGAFEGFGDFGLKVSISAPEICPTCSLGTGLLYTITVTATGFPVPAITVSGDDRVESVGEGVYQIELCSYEQVELEFTATSGSEVKWEYLVLPKATAPEIDLIVLEGPTLIAGLTASGDEYRYVLQATPKGYPSPDITWVNATPAEKGDTTVTVTVPKNTWLWQFPIVYVTATNTEGSATASLKLPVGTLIEDSGAGFSDLSGQVMICPPDKDPEDEDSWDLADIRTELPRGTRIRTADESEAILGFADMTSYVLKPNSTIIIVRPPAEQGKVSLVLGNIWMNIKNMVKDGSMDIEMNQAVAGIKGTVFECSEDGVTSTLIVYEGEVEFTSRATGDSIVVSAGEMITATSTGLGQLTTHGGVPVTSESPPTPPLPPDPDDTGSGEGGMPQTSDTTSDSMNGTSTPNPAYVPSQAPEETASFPLTYAVGGLVLVAGVVVLGITKSKKR